MASPHRSRPRLTVSCIRNEISVRKTAQAKRNLNFKALPNATGRTQAGERGAAAGGVARFRWLHAAFPGRNEAASLDGNRDDKLPRTLLDGLRGARNGGLRHVRGRGCPLRLGFHRRLP